jgi:hypothetical protein
MCRYVVTGGNTSPLSRHLHRDHPELFLKYFSMLPEEKQRTSKLRPLGFDSNMVHVRSKDSFFSPATSPVVSLVPFWCDYVL